MEDYRLASLEETDRAMLDFAIRLTESPAQIRQQDLAELHRLGFDAVAIHDIVQVTALFNYYNRLADGLGIDPEPNWPFKKGPSKRDSDFSGKKILLSDQRGHCPLFEGSKVRDR